MNSRPVGLRKTRQQRLTQSGGERRKHAQINVDCDFDVTASICKLKDLQRGEVDERKCAFAKQAIIHNQYITLSRKLLIETESLVGK